MTTPILSTKLNVPPARLQVVRRPRLIEQLDQGSVGKLTLISAPAGFGKTTLVSDWIADYRRPTAWLSLDEADSELTRFLIYLVATVQTVQTPLGTSKAGTGEAGTGQVGMKTMALLRSPPLPPTETILTALLNEIAAIPEDFFLVLDDYHVIENKAVNSALVYLLDHLPPQMHLVIATREDPPLPTARLRAQGQLAELRAANLRFTDEETGEFLNRILALDLSSEQITTLASRTEGWIAGLQLAAISMRGQSDRAGFIDSFSGSHRFVMDYLIEEVLEQQPASVQTFLLQTTILDRLTGSLCDAVTGQTDSQAILKQLESANLFLFALDEERRWYRYHHLFGDLLRQRLLQTFRDQIPTYQRRASQWYEGNGHVDEAIEYALRAKSYERAAALIERVAENIWASGIENRLRHWLERLPIDLIFFSPILSIYHAWYLLAEGHPAEADSAIQRAEMALETRLNTVDASASTKPRQGSDLDSQTMRGRIAVVLAFSAFYRGDVPAIIDHAHRALEILPEQKTSWRSVATHLLGDGYDFGGEMRDAYRWRMASVAVSRISGDNLQILIANLKLAITLRHQGMLQQVIELCESQMALANNCGIAQTAVAGWLLAIWGEVLAELDDLDGAIKKTTLGVELTEVGGDVAMHGWSFLCLIRTHFSAGDYTSTQEAIQRIERLAQSAFVPPWIMTLVTAWQARLWLAQGKTLFVDDWIVARGLDARYDPDYAHEWTYMVYARVLIAQGHSRQAIALLSRQLTAAEAGGRVSRMIEIEIIQSLASQAEGQIASAAAHLGQALTLAEPGGFVRAFIDEGAPMVTLLDEAIARGKSPAFAQRLLTHFPQHKPKTVIRATPAASRFDLVEPLSQRELEVLSLIAQGLSNREIANRLYVTVNTVKGHNQNIFGKLQVRRRTEAVARARELGLL